MNELKESHLRALSSLALLTEKRLMEIEFAFIKPEFHQPVNIFYKEDLSAEQINQLRKVIHRFKEELQSFSTLYQIKEEENSIQREVYTKSVFLWETFCEYTGHRLKEYGALKEETLHGIEEHVNALIALSLEMQQICINDIDKA
jgi:hypothetical protein